MKSLDLGFGLEEKFLFTSMVVFSVFEGKDRQAYTLTHGQTRSKAIPASHSLVGTQKIMHSYI